MTQKETIWVENSEKWAPENHYKIEIGTASMGPNEEAQIQHKLLKGGKSLVFSKLIRLAKKKVVGGDPRKVAMS